MNTTLNPIQRRVLAAVQLAHDATEADMVTLADVKTGLAVNRRGRRPLTDEQVRTALARLVVAEELRRVDVAGMGGKMSAWSARAPRERSASPAIELNPDHFA